MLHLELLKNKVTVTAPAETKLCELSFGFESASQWFFGRGVYALEFSRRKLPDKSAIVTVMPLSEVKDMEYSNITAVGHLVKIGYWPKQLAFDKLWSIQGDRKEIRDGMHRLLRTTKEETIVQSHGLDLTTNLGTLAFGLADFTMGFFWKGAHSCKVQYSLAVQQYKIDKGFDEKELQKYLQDTKNPDYSVDQLVGTLPI